MKPLNDIYATVALGLPLEDPKKLGTTFKSICTSIYTRLHPKFTAQKVRLTAREYAWYFLSSVLQHNSINFDAKLIACNQQIGRYASLLVSDWRLDRRETLHLLIVNLVQAHLLLPSLSGWENHFIKVANAQFGTSAGSPVKRLVWQPLDRMGSIKALCDLVKSRPKKLKEYGPLDFYHDGDWVEDNKLVQLLPHLFAISLPNGSKMYPMKTVGWELLWSCARDGLRINTLRWVFAEARRQGLLEIFAKKDEQEEEGCLVVAVDNKHSPEFIQAIVDGYDAPYGMRFIDRKFCVEAVEQAVAWKNWAHVKILMQLGQEGAINKRRVIRTIDDGGCVTRTYPLIWAVEHRSQWLVKKLLGEKGIYPQIYDAECNMRPIHMSIETQDAYVLRVLLRSNDLDYTYELPKFYFKKNRFLEKNEPKFQGLSDGERKNWFVQEEDGYWCWNNVLGKSVLDWPEGHEILLLEQPDPTTGLRPLHQAVVDGNVQRVKGLLEQGADVLAPVFKGNSPHMGKNALELAKARKMQNLAVFKLFLEEIKKHLPTEKK